MAPIGIGIAQETGLRTAICLGAVVCGAMFGDNRSMISDTTIAAVRTQGCEMKDKFKENLSLYFGGHHHGSDLFLRGESGDCQSGAGQIRL